MTKVFIRKGDMSPEGRLRVILQPDGDAIVAIIDDPNVPAWEKGSVEFCSVGGGGGRSRHTLEAIRALALAIQRDNEESPLPMSEHWESKW